MKRARIISAGLVSITAVLLGAAQLRADLYSGNGNTGFGGPLGTGSLTLTDNGTTVNGTFTRGSGNHNDFLVIYIDSKSGGFSTTSGFSDQNDYNRNAISGLGSDGRSTVNFASGFLADYAIALANNGFSTFGGLWGLANGGNNSLPFVDSVNLSGGNDGTLASYTFDFNFSEVMPDGGNSFKFVATYVAKSGYRSNEAIGASDAPGGGTNIALGTLNYSDYRTYVSVVPEPGAFLLCGAVAVLAASVAVKKRMTHLRANSADRSV